MRPHTLFVVDLGKDGLRIQLTGSDILAPAIYWGGKFEPRIYDFIKSILQPGMTVFDIGANIGQYTLLAAHCVGPKGQVHSFEPASREFSILRSNVILNGFTNVILQNLAVSSYDGEAVLTTCPEGRGSFNTIGTLTHPFAVELRTWPVRVRCVRLDSYIRDQQLEKVDMIKIDIEGAERDLLLGAQELLSEYMTPLVICEFADNTSAGFNSSGAELYECFESYGYHLYEITEKSGVLRIAPKKQEYVGDNLVAVKPYLLSKWNLSVRSSSR